MRYEIRSINRKTVIIFASPEKFFLNYSISSGKNSEREYKILLIFIDSHYTAVYNEIVNYTVV